jgi:Leucine-rich repeat (LRR) protein
LHSSQRFDQALCVSSSLLLLLLLQALPRCLTKLPKLSTLVAAHNPIAQLPGSISKLTGLLDLNMSHCALTAVPQVRHTEFELSTD